ncbi:AGAP008026-PA-like protein [Anopheles sinensis]|uniref:AGAP008026-PA-like protein n=1 Tax=Anopheles sinensis TaxID=74873 RepID=A0A084WV11_ANOSI|nr:AGAP008026-PA-like protein [Anopheles sinensis]
MEIGGDGADERTFAASGGGVNNSDIIVIKSEDGTTSVKQEKREQEEEGEGEEEVLGEKGSVEPAGVVLVHTGEDFEQLIDSVNSRNRSSRKQQ